MSPHLPTTGFITAVFPLTFGRAAFNLPADARVVGCLVRGEDGAAGVVGVVAQRCHVVGTLEHAGHEGLTEAGEVGALAECVYPIQTYRAGTGKQGGRRLACRSKHGTISRE